jgi:signal transduction histidine kinase
MSLRARILALFLGLGVVPILLLGIIGYARSMRAVRAFLEAQTYAIAHQVASELGEQHEQRLSELLLLAENAETQRLYRARAGRSSLPADSALVHATEYLSMAWRQFQGSYREIRLETAEGEVLLTLGSTSPRRPGVSEEPSYPSRTARLTIPVQDLEAGEEVGLVAADVYLRAISPEEALEVAFGDAGLTMLLNWRVGEILHHPQRRFVNQPLSALLGSEAWDLDSDLLTIDSGSFEFRQADSSNVASFVRLHDPPWMVISTASVEEFALPFSQAERVDLLIVLLLAAIVGGLFIVITRRTTASLEALTVAAERVGHGDLNPPIPSSGPDEVGRLSAAFGLMVEQVRRMLRRVEDTRQIAVMGELASSVSHQIRNPLTSIKLNLQSLDEEARAEGLSETSIRSLGICLREVGHLEEAVSRMRALVRTHPPMRVRALLHSIIEEAVELLESQLENSSVRVDLRLDASHDGILADPEDVKSAFVNLLVNAEEAMAGGGTVRIGTSNPSGTHPDGIIRTEVADEGPGVPDEAREQIFRPFVTSKKDGTGFGLAIARLAIQEHMGTLSLKSDAGSGATFVVELPLTRSSNGNNTAGSGLEHAHRRTPEIDNTEHSPGLGRAERQSTSGGTRS